MKFLIAIDLQSFSVPDFIYEEYDQVSGSREARKFHLSELDDDTLEQMCLEFRNEIFRKAGRTSKITSVIVDKG